MTDSNGNMYYQICNNYQLGNFGILPIHGGINPKRAADPYFDFFDIFLLSVYAFYNEDVSFEGELANAIKSRKDYFQQFDSAEDFVNRNMLTEYFYNQEDNEIGTYDDLTYFSKMKSFEEYVQAVTTIITRRGKYIWNILAGPEQAEDLKVPSNENAESPKVDIPAATAYFRDKYTLEHKLAEKIAKVAYFQDS